MKVQDLIEYFGAKHKISEALGLSRTRGYALKDPLPLHLQIKFQIISGGALQVDFDEQMCGGSLEEFLVTLRSKE